MAEKVLILGAASQISQYLIPDLLEQTDAKLTLFARNGNRRLKKFQNKAGIIDGDWNNTEELVAALKGQDLVYLATVPNTSVSKKIVAAMKQASVKRLIAAGGLGIFDEVAGKFGEWNARMIGDYTDIKEASFTLCDPDLDVTFLRMSWLYDQDNNTKYEIVPEGQPYKGTQVTRQAVAQLITDIVKKPSLYSQQNIGVVEPNTEWDKPSFY
ncbi:NAD(P)H-binding protein [Companilactobacillus huachuanensis]|uniref:NAD(P)H-binding protein n=1 Tax=Companilactobacillus huachuanensis TaxID=2559914 RepID=A0ABW1RNT5_9LACO|nr:NAD(P)H-binding protein [Companilactobacillus huachuanensis]